MIRWADYKRKCIIPFFCVSVFLVHSCHHAALADRVSESSNAEARSDPLPRKVIIGTLMCSAQNRIKKLGDRLTFFEEVIDELAEEAEEEYPSQGLDLVVLPETALSSGLPGDAPDKAVPLEGSVLERMGAKACQYSTYIIVTMVLPEVDDGQARCSNAAVLLDRTGEAVGIYRKVHPVAYLHSDSLERGIIPGSEFPVFDCDFGRLGIQICWDMSYEDGWQALAEQGAEIIALPTASPQTVRPASYALRGRCYIVTSTGGDNASIFNPIGRICAQTTESRTLVHQVDLSFAILHWSPPLREGKLLSDQFGDRVGYEYFHTESTGVFWSNDPTKPIKTMVHELGLEEMHEQVARNRILQDAARRSGARVDKE